MGNEARLATMDQMEKSLTNHPIKSDITIMQIERLRADAKNLGTTVISFCPEGDERNIAICKLEECVMWAVKSIALMEADNK